MTDFWLAAGDDLNPEDYVMDGWQGSNLVVVNYRMKKVESFVCQKKDTGTDSLYNTLKHATVSL